MEYNFLNPPFLKNLNEARRSHNIKQSSILALSRLMEAFLKPFQTSRNPNTIWVLLGLWAASQKENLLKHGRRHQLLAWRQHWEIKAVFCQCCIKVLGDHFKVGARLQRQSHHLAHEVALALGVNLIHNAFAENINLGIEITEKKLRRFHNGKVGVTSETFPLAHMK